MAEYHEPVLLSEILEALDLKPGETVLDGTLGTGGHARELLRRVLPGGRLVATDRDPAMLAIGSERLKGDFSEFESAMSFHAIPYEKAPAVLASADAVLLDLGFNSLQIDDHARGFSFQGDAALDMRYNASEGGPTAADLVNTASERELAGWFMDYADERHAWKIARRIAQERRSKAFSRTGELAALVSEVYPPKDRHGRIHPATRVFMALRIAVNDELGAVERGVAACRDLLAPGGRMAVISFHSAEDRIVKRLFDEVASPRATPDDPYRATSTDGLEFEIPSRRAIVCTDEEAERNPRARSSKLRVIRRKGGRS